MNNKGVLVGCDYKQEWLLPWWWKHYSAHSSLPVVFIDLGMTEEGIAWCKKKGEYFALTNNQLISSKQELSSQKQESWENRYGKEIWSVRPAWLKKPSALLCSPFDGGLWLDLDCQIKGDLDPIFDYLSFSELAVVRDREQNFDFLLPGEVNYNSGVIAFRKGGNIIQQWAEMTTQCENQFPGDQELLTRAIFNHKPPLIELPSIYNWYRAWGPNEKVIIHHFCGGLGKIEILKGLGPDYFQGIGIPKKWT